MNGVFKEVTSSETGDHLRSYPVIPEGDEMPKGSRAGSQQRGAGLGAGTARRCCKERAPHGLVREEGAAPGLPWRPSPPGQRRRGAHRTFLPYKGGLLQDKCFPRQENIRKLRDFGKGLLYQQEKGKGPHGLELSIQLTCFRILRR